MREYFFSEKTFEKKVVFFFMDDDRAPLDDVEVGSEVSLCAKDERGKKITIQFRITRNVHLGERVRWIYGMVLDDSDDEYYQIELRLHKDSPKMDTIQVFIQAPPISYQ